MKTFRLAALFLVACLSAAVAGADLGGWKDPVQVATTGSVAHTGLPTIDGVTLTDGASLLDKDSAGAIRGIWVVHSGAWTRRTDADASPEVVTGMRVCVQAGAVNAGKCFKLTTAAPIVLGTTSLTFADEGVMNFDALTSGTNSTAAMVVGTGAGLGTSGSGVIDPVMTNTHLLRWAGRSEMSSPADGNVLFTDDAGTAFGLFQLGGTAATFPALKRNATAIDFRLADDSGYAGITAGAITAVGQMQWNGGAGWNSLGGDIGAQTGLVTACNTCNFSFSSTAAWNGASDVYLSRGGAAATLQLGAADSATPAAQTLTAQGSRAGVDTNVAGASLTIASGAGTGNATPSDLLLQVPMTGSTGTTGQSFATKFALHNKIYSMGDAATVDLLTVGVPTSNTGCAAHLSFTYTANDAGTNSVAHAGIAIVAFSNLGGTVTGTVANSGEAIDGTGCGAGCDTWSVNVAGTNATVRASFNNTISVTGTLTYQVLNNSCPSLTFN